ncbi:tRNA epoxyqueuosine(34) reductase QueG [Clostridium sp. P21]|uniref:tRNA epoxyqueuosine(34) reductase QueG n=1 Tax=Clostridium muellerianum TaxID=2716538 RepID=A0A7Y0HPQ0_9CLOT|nr:tRNA epoxyqueuosine(34) reductase QueG [Clostridium muellerianum]NMM65294.1 tRNA epoxyqueuosine(34) reductase QueG [Clostridium muellerianum]
MNYKDMIINYCKEIGLDTVGFTSCRVFSELKHYFEYRKSMLLTNEFEEQDIDKKINPHIYMENGKTIISIAFPYLFNNDFEQCINFSKYTKGRDYHVVVSEYLKKICNFIEKEMSGKAVYFVDSNSLPERYIAKLCGIGFIGKNNMIITEKYGSYVFLGEIITDVAIEEDEPMECKCGDCSLCEDACPTGAVKGENNSNICLSYISQKKEIEDKWFDKLKGRIFGCDTCQRICPFNKEICFSNIEEFKPYDFMEIVDLHELANIDKKTFLKKYSKSSCGWRGKNILQRNTLINMMSMNKNVDIKEITSPYVKNYYNRLLQHFKL